MTKKKCIIYARSAVKPQKGKFSAIDWQIQQLKKFAKNFDCEVVDVISESGSGMSGSERRCMNLLRRLKKHHVQGILCTKWDRLTRDVLLYAKLKKIFEQNGIEIITLDEEDEDFNNLMYILYLRKSTED